MKNKWMMSRAGLFNFWYYDDEILDFANGKLLLRGSNGSGKSVTMQSFIPLLLDGNKSPERLDPFGSRARKMENYLLGENEDIDERTGYVFLEFKRESTDNYLTIGIGIKARKSKKLSSWGFSITDGRRIGIDFFLYKNMGQKVPLSKKELQNRIGLGGEVVESQKEYMSMVNKLLFGFESIDDYDELIKLLIQLRSPKLSKEFKPTVLYNIMSNSLQTLTEDDLRPMSEAIENMETIKITLQSLKENEKAAKSLKRVFDKYNKFILFDKAKGLKDEKGKLSSLQKQLTEVKKLLSDYKDEYDLSIQKLQKLEQEQRLIEDEEKRLRQHESYKFSEKLSKLEEEGKYILKQIEKKQKNIKGKKVIERQLNDQIKSINTDIEINTDKINKFLTEMDELAEEIYFDEHKFMKNEIASQDNFSFNIVKMRINSYHKAVNKGLKVLEEQRRREKEYDKQLKKFEDKQREKEEKRRQMEQRENLLFETKEEFVELIYSWADNCNELVMPKDALSLITSKANRYGQDVTYDDILQEVRNQYSVVSKDINNKLWGKERELKQKESELNEVKQTIEEWKNKKDPEPEREEKVINNRIILTEKNIPHEPLYKLVNFKKDLPKQYKSVVEEALLDMGLLDALVIPKKFRDEVLKIDGNTADKYIFESPKFLQHELTGMLSVEKSDVIKLEQVENVLRSILLDYSKDNIYINENGEYGIGIIRGKVSGQYVPKFIGSQARKQYREKIINDLLLQKGEIDKHINLIKGDIDKFKIRISTLEHEMVKFPPKDDLETALEEYKGGFIDYNAKCRETKEQEKETNKAYNALKESKQKVIDITQRILLPKNVDVYEQAIEDIEEYKNYLNRLEITYKNIMQNKDRVEDLNYSYSEIIADLDDLLYETGDLQKRLSEIKNTIDNIHKQLKLSDYESIKNRINECIKKLKQLPTEIKNMVAKKSCLNEKIKQSTDKEYEITDEYNLQKKIYQLCFDVFKDEVDLKYVIDDTFKDQDLFDLAVRIVTQYQSNFSGNRSKDDFTKALQEQFFSHFVELRDYNLTMKEIFVDDISKDEIDLIKEIKFRHKRIDLIARLEGKEVGFLFLVDSISKRITEKEQLLKQKDRELFENILANNISKIIRAKISHSQKWVKKMNQLMQNMDTSSGLSLSLKWKSKVAETEEELDTKELVSILMSDAHLLKEEDFNKLAKHFRIKIHKSQKYLEQTGNHQNFLSVVKEILDYRKWFEFQLFYQKTGERKRELTNNAFDRFSGGEKAMSMYVPLFSSVYAKYEGARADAPKIISLDEAFAGVDEKNIRDMFRLMIELDFNFIINSQSLWGTYDTIDSLSICELIRPNNEKCVAVVRYIWNGKNMKYKTKAGMSNE